MGWGAEGVEAGYQKRSLGSEAWEERTVGLRQRRDQQGGWVLQEITRRPPGTVLTPAGRTATQNLHVLWLLSHH